MFLLVALFSCFSVPPSAQAETNINTYYPYVVELTDIYNDGHQDPFKELHLPCNQEFTGFATNWQYPITRETEFALTGSHKPTTHYVYGLMATGHTNRDLVYKVVEHRCELPVVPVSLAGQ